MISQNHPAQALAALLDQNKQAIAASWADKICQNASLIPSKQWIDNIPEATMQALRAIIVMLDTGSSADLEFYLSELCAITLQSGFESGEVAEALLLSRDAIMPLFVAAADIETHDVWALFSELDNCLRWMLGRFSNLCAANTTARLRTQHERTMLMLKLGQSTPSSLDIDQLLTHVAEGIMESVDVAHCDFYLVNENQKHLTPKLGIARLKQPPVMIDLFLDSAPDPTVDGFLRQVLTTKEPAVCYNVATDPRVNGELMRAMGIKSVLAVPLVAHDNVLAIAMTGSFSEYRAFTEEQIELARDVARAAALVIENARLYEKWMAENRSIQRIITALLQELELDEILKIVCAETQLLTGAQESAVYFLEGTHWLSRVFSTSDNLTFERISTSESLSGKALETRQPYSVNDPSKDERLFCNDNLPSNFLIAPLIANDTRLGVLYATNKPVNFCDNDIRIVSIFADHVAIAIENARLHQQLQQMAALKERERLAREIHDNLAQGLSVLKLQASNIDYLLQNGQIEQAQHYLHEMKQTATDAHADAREAIFSLRNGATSPSEFLLSIQKYVDRFRRTYGISVELNIQPDAASMLPMSAITQLTRIIQEALVNVRKHAVASQVAIHIKRLNDQLIVTVEDDGRGFDLAVIEHDSCSGVGLQIMQERAEALAGNLTVDTWPNRGTCITVQIPIPNRR